MRLGIGLSTLVCAACANGVAQPQSSASDTASTSPGPVAACVLGTWSTTGVSLQASAPAGEASLSGGGGVFVRVAPDGKTDIDFDTMDPANFAATNGEAALTGQFRYGGHASGQIRTGDATSTSGTWEPVGKTNFSAVRITVDLTDPIKLRPFDNVPLTPLIVGDKQMGGDVEADPMLTRSNYTCGTGTLTLSRSDGTGLTWQLTRKS